MKRRMSIRGITCLCLMLGLMTGCAEEFIVFHSASGDPLLISRRAFTSEETLQAARCCGHSIQAMPAKQPSAQNNHRQVPIRWEQTSFSRGH